MFKKIIATAVAAFLFTASLGAVNVTVFVHGKSGKNHNGTGTTDVNNYWGASPNTVSGTKYFVGYDGTSDPRTYGTARAQTNLSTVMTNICKTNTCKIVCHSAGCYATEYWLSNLGGTASSKGFKITGVTALAAASGGSELASALNGITFGYAGNAMDKALIVSTARSSFNHNNTSAILPGEDDYAVAYHSSCGYSTAGGLSKCQSSITQSEGVWPFNSNKTYTQYSGHTRAPSLTATGLYENHSEITDDGWR
jgi:triacylglycerol esterase/lipase EstA (alpha/beta hydrolase family)